MMKFIDLQEQYQQVAPQINRAINQVLVHGQYIMGPEVFELEARLASFVGVKHCITMTSGTLALQVALMALGVGPGDEVITSPFSFFATVETILLLGAVPIFVDIDPQTYNLNPTLLEAAITSKTKVILPVSLYGQCAELIEINKIAERYGLPVIEDGAQSFGATHQGKPSCGITTIACTSFFPSKPLGCYGDGGACFTNDEALAEKMRCLRNHGQEERYHHVLLGTNARFDTIQAAILLEKLDLFQEELKKRQIIANWYKGKLNGYFVTPYVAADNVSTYAQYTIRVKDRQSLIKHLNSRGIPTAIHYPKALHHQPVVESILKQSTSCPFAEVAAEEVLSLPFHPYLTEEAVNTVCEELLACSMLTYQAA